MRGVLAAVDLGSGSRAVLESAKVMAEALKGPLTVLHVVADGYLRSAPRRFAEVWEPELEPLFAQASAELGRLARKKLERLAPEGAELKLPHGNPTQEVAAEARHHALAVLAAEGSTPLERVARGGVSRYLMHRGEVPVLNVRPDRPLEKLGTIAVAVDDSSAALAALKAGRALAEASGAGLVAFHLISVGPQSCCVPQYLPPDALEAADLDRQAEAALRRTLDYDGPLVVARGEEIVGLLDLAHEHGADLLIVGSKAKSSHWTRLGRSVVGLLYAADLPLLVVPEAVHL
ncbi:MAG TPA: universal stress protein [Oceanithermus profundus]|uniref:Universal stress protein n=1 Tax=Oceanithermus profundus TaxID=187137 RepID=A0A7C4Z4W6_9DEIN|nr:universal stress protein [Oceanithermus profundus]